MAQWDFAQSLAGAGDKLVTLTAGEGGWVKGDPLVLSATTAGAWVRATAVTAKPKYVAQADCVTAAAGVAVACLPENVFRVTMTGAGTVGGQYDLQLTTAAINTSGTTTKAVEIVGIDEVTSTIAYVISRGWLA
jgi:hypothetical protein